MKKYKVWNKVDKIWTKNVILIQEGVLLWQFGDSLSDIEVPDDFVVCFSIGLKDKQGKEIYEGDVIKLGHTEFEVIFEDFAYRLKKTKGKITVLGDFWEIDKSCSKAEVIGNIYENPELLHLKNK